MRSPGIVRGPIGTTAAVAGRIFVTASSGRRGDRLHVLSFDASDGKRVWERQFQATGRTMCHPKTCMAAPTPASDSKRIFAFYSTNDLFALDLDGNLLWARGLTWDYPNASNSMGMASSPLVAGSTVVVQVENQSCSFAAALDAATGENLWKIERLPKPSWSTPSLARLRVTAEEGAPEVAVVLLQSWDRLSAHDPATGRELWGYESPTNCIPSPLALQDVVLLPAGGMVGLRPKPGSSVPEVAWESPKLRPGMSSPIVDGGRIYTLAGNGILSCGDARTGEVAWQLRLKGEFSSTPAIAGRRLFAASEEGLLHLVRLGERGAEGQPAPKAEIEATKDLKETILASPAVSGGALYLRSDAHLWKIGGKPKERSF